MGGNRNRSAGHQLERMVADILRKIGFPHTVTTRSESKSRDDSGIDLMNKDEMTNGRLPYNIQCKNTVERPKYDMLLQQMPTFEGVRNVVIHKYSIKQGSKFNTRGYYAILDMKDFMEMVEELHRLKQKEVKDAGTN